MPSKRRGRPTLRGALSAAIARDVDADALRAGVFEGAAEGEWGAKLRSLPDLAPLFSA